MAQTKKKPSFDFADSRSDRADELKPAPLAVVSQSPSAQRPLRARVLITVVVAVAAILIFANVGLPTLLLVASGVAVAVLLLVVWGNWILNNVQF